MAQQQLTGCIASDAEYLLGLFEADCGVLVVEHGTKMFGPDEYRRESLAIAEYFMSHPFRYGYRTQVLQTDTDGRFVQRDTGFSGYRHGFPGPEK